MVYLMRKYQQGLMLIVTVVVIVSFVWFFNVTQTSDRNSPDRVGSIYGHAVSLTQFSREQRKFGISRALGLDLWNNLIGDARSEETAVDNYVWNGFVLRHEAAALGLAPTKEEVTQAIEKLPVFQTNANFDISKYNSFVEKMGSRGFSGAQIDELVREDLQLAKLKALLGTSVNSPADEVRTMYLQRNQQTEVSVVRLDLAELTKTTQVTDDEVKKTYEERKDAIKSDELRKVKIITFAPQKSDKPLAGNDRMAELVKLGDRATEFCLAMAQPNAKLEEVAIKFNATIVETPEFSASKVPAPLDQAMNAAATVFESLTLEKPNSDVIMGRDAYYVVQLAGVTPARPLSFEEAKDKLTAQLKEEHAREALQLKMAELHHKIQAAIAAGKSFADAAVANGLKPETLPPFSMSNPLKNTAPDAYPIMSQSFNLQPNQLSEWLPTRTGATLVHLDKHLPIDEQKFELEKTKLAEDVKNEKLRSAVALWLKERRSAAQPDAAVAKG